MDRISNLPDEILDLILERLSLIDKVRTSALSRIWRCRWTGHPSLIMDYRWYCFVKMRKSDPLELARVVESVVSQHRGCVRGLSLFVPTSYNLCPTTLSIYKDVVCSATNKSSSTLERLTLKRGDENKDLLLPPSIFSLVNLRHLEITWFEFQPPSWFEGFPNLTSFSLVSETVSYDTVSQFVSRCPQLETVSVKFPCPPQDGNFDLKAPQLRHLQIKGSLNDVFVSNAQNLDSITLAYPFSVSDEDVSDKSFRLLSSSKQLKHISLHGKFCKILGRCKVIHDLPKYGLMRSLKLKSIVLDQVDQLQCVLSLFAASPKLTKLVLIMARATRYKIEEVELYEAMIEKYITADFECLVRVDLHGITGTKIQMRIIESLLRFSPILEMMYINFDSEEEELKLQEVIPKFHRASTMAKLKFIDRYTTYWQI